MSISAERYYGDRDKRLSPTELVETGWCTLRIKEADHTPDCVGAFAVDSIVRVCLIMPGKAEDMALRNGYTVVIDYEGEMQMRHFNGDNVIVDTPGGSGNETGYALGSPEPANQPHVAEQSSRIGRVAQLRSLISA